MLQNTNLTLSHTEIWPPKPQAPKLQTLTSTQTLTCNPASKLYKTKIPKSPKPWSPTFKLRTMNQKTPPISNNTAQALSCARNVFIKNLTYTLMSQHGWNMVFTSPTTHLTNYIDRSLSLDIDVHLDYTYIYCTYRVYNIHDQKTHGENVLGQTMDAAGQVLGHHTSLHSPHTDPLQSLTEPTCQQTAGHHEHKHGATEGYRVKGGMV